MSTSDSNANEKFKTAANALTELYKSLLHGKKDAYAEGYTQGRIDAAREILAFLVQNPHVDSVEYLKSRLDGQVKMEERNDTGDRGFKRMRYHDMLE